MLVDVTGLAMVVGRTLSSPEPLPDKRADDTYQKEFFEDIVADVRQALAVQAAYLAVAAITNDRPLGLPGALGSVVPNKLALRLAEPTDLAFFSLNPKEVGKLGFLRGVDASTKLELQVAVPHPEGLIAGVAATAAAWGHLAFSKWY